MNICNSTIEWWGLFSHESVMSALVSDLLSSRSNQSTTSVADRRFTCLVVGDPPLSSRELKELSESIRDNASFKISSDLVQTGLNSLSLNNLDSSAPSKLLPNNGNAVEQGVNEENVDVKCLQKKRFDSQINSPDSIRAYMLDFVQSLKKSKTSQLKNDLLSNGLSNLGYALKDTRITTLNLSDNNIDCDLLIDLAQHLQSTQIRSLDLSANAIRRKGFKYLNEVLGETSISSLNVSRNSPAEVAFRQKSAAKESSTNDVYDETIECDGWWYQAEILRNTVTTYLDLSNVNIDPKYVASILKNSKIEHLDLNHSEINKSFGLFAPYLVNSNITTLNLSGNKLGNDGVKILACVLKNTKIHSLDLSANRIDGDGMKVFAPCLVDSKITYLNLSHNPFDSDGMNSLALVLPNTKITSLDIHCCISNSRRSLDILSACLVQSKITSLGFFGNVPNDYDGIQSLAVALKNTQISSIDFGFKFNTSDSIVQLLALCAVGSKLSYISLSHCSIDSSLMEHLVIVLKNSNIASIKLLGTSMNHEVMRIFVRCFVDSKISNLRLSNSDKLDIDAVECLALVLKNTQITSLDLSSNRLDCESLKVLAPHLVDTKLTYLNLEKNEIDCNHKISKNKGDYKIDDVGVKCLALALKNSQITNLNLGENRMKCKSLMNLIMSLQDTRITELNLSCNDVCCNVFYLAYILKNTQIRSLNLGRIQSDMIHYLQVSNTDTSLNLTSKMQCKFGLCYLPRILQTENITSLNLSRNQIECEELKDLCQCLSGSQIVSLDLSDNRIKCDGVHYLAQVLQRTKISSLNLSRNEISTIGIKYLALSLPGSQLTTLDVSYNFITNENIEYLADILVNTEIVDLNLSGNQIGCCKAVYHLCERVQCHLQNGDFSHHINLFNYPGCTIEIYQISYKEGIDHVINNYVCNKTEITKVYIRSHSAYWFHLSNLADVDHINITEIEMSKHSWFPHSMFKRITKLKLNDTRTRYDPGENGEKIIELRLQNIQNIELDKLGEFRFSNIMYLDLSNNNLEDDRFECLAKAFEYSCRCRSIQSESNKISRLISLNLSNNKLGRRSAELLVKHIFHIRTLTYIDLHGNNIGYSGFQTIMSEVDKTNLCWLSLGANNIEEQLQEDIELSPYIVPQKDIPVAFQVRYLFRQLVSLNTSSGEFEFIIPRQDSNPPVNITHYVKLVKIYVEFKYNVELWNIHVYDNYYMESKKHDMGLLEKIEKFVKEMKDRFFSFINNNVPQLEQAFGYDSFVLLVKECERFGLNEFVEFLLLHRVLYYVDEEKEILHPFIYRMMHKYRMPLYCERIEPNKRKQIIAYFQKHPEIEDSKLILNLLE